jgi:hypothetical protein
VETRKETQQTHDMAMNNKAFIDETYNIAMKNREGLAALGLPSTTVVSMVE